MGVKRGRDGLARHEMMLALRELAFRDAAGRQLL
jgi:hypothetical protein